MCGIAAVCLGRVGDLSVVDLLEASFLLQHRGQDACGIATSDQTGSVYRHRDLGLAAEVFANPHNIADLYGHVGLLHLRYGTAGSYGVEEAQPLYSHAAGSMFLCHNGNLINTWEIQQHLGKGPFLHPFNTADSGLLLAVFARALQALTGEQPKTIDPNHVFTALKEIYAQCKGSFACLAMLAKGAVLGFRDANGIRPLVYGERVNVDGTTDYMFSSESVALTKLSYTNIKDVLPGQAVLIQPVDAHRKTARVIVRQVVPRLTYTPDIFEYVYLARPESVMDGISVHLSRKNMGNALATTIKSQLGPDVASKLDAVIPVPETAQTSALSASQKLNVPYSHGIVKNRYIFRTFIMPEQAMRRQGVLRKLNAVKEEFEDKDVVLVDDSIVRGTTSKEIVQMARNAGANKVVLASCSPPIRFNHIHGINLAETTQLVAYNRTNAEICEKLGADELVYLPLPALIQSCLDVNPSGDVKEFEVGIFTGDYITGGHDEYVQHVREGAKAAKAAKAAEIAIQSGTVGVKSKGPVMKTVSKIASKGETVVERFSGGLLTT